MDKSLIEKRQFPRINAVLPIKITPEFLGETIDLSETGLKFVLEKPLLTSRVNAKIAFSTEQSIDTEFKVIWNKHLISDGKFFYGACFIRLQEKDVEILRKMAVQSKANDTLGGINDSVVRDKTFAFYKDIQTYITGVDRLNRQIERKGNMADADEVQKLFYSFTDEIMHKAELFEKSDIQKKIINRVKQSFRELISNWIYKGNIVKRGHEKPRGYPGDYMTLESIYNNRPLSEGIGYYSDKYFLDNDYAAAVRLRKDKMKDVITEYIKQAKNLPVRILNIACGSCREIKELLIDNKLFLDKKLSFTLLDQDEEALAYSKNLFKDLSANIRFDYIHQDILMLIREKNCKINITNQDLIYSIGLADYLPDRMLKNLMQFCCQLLDSQGKFIITHKDIDKCYPAQPDWFCDWNFYSRNQEDLIQLIKSIDAPIVIDNIFREDSERILFFSIKKT